MTKFILASLLAFTGSAFAADCTTAIAKDAIKRAIADEGLFAEIASERSTSGRIGFEVDQSPRHEAEFVTTISYFKGDSADAFATADILTRVVDFDKCTLQPMK